ncbi:MAG: hypothetical protein RR459_07585 [Christensenellaceae bacterium]
MKRIVSIVLCLVVLCIAAGCSCGRAEETPVKISSEQGTATIATPIPSDKAPELLVTPTPLPTATAGKNENVPYKDKQSIEVKYYDEGSQKTVVKEYKPAKNAGNAQAAMDAVNETISKDLLGGKKLETNTVVYTDGNAFIDFKGTVYDKMSMSAVENSVLEAIADAFLNNVDGIKGVYYSVDGKPYSSQHIEIPQDQPYKTK